MAGGLHSRSPPAALRLMNAQANLELNDRELKISVVHVYRCKNQGDATLYCGRSTGRIPNWMWNVNLGNPFSVSQYGRGTCIAKYEKALMSGQLRAHERRINKIAKRIQAQGYKHIQLACWCAPKSCHCDIIKQHILRQID